ncbi:unnamed protein product [Brassica rapa]|uniref:Uncharacterized protein n=1 Tax=Brassica campestris TaxID=3711 RepID=A0A3P5ZUP2_BRACM|nr:unnamed protein product [Brassica rapa]VDC76231.1 unnamed protein product [Brassica rapa]
MKLVITCFLRCAYAEQIWKLVIRRLGYRPSCSTLGRPFFLGLA